MQGTKDNETKLEFWIENHTKILFRALNID